MYPAHNVDGGSSHSRTRVYVTSFTDVAFSLFWKRTKHHHHTTTRMSAPDASLRRERGQHSGVERHRVVASTVPRRQSRDVHAPHSDVRVTTVIRSQPIRSQPIRSRPPPSLVCAYFSPRRQFIWPYKPRVFINNSFKPHLVQRTSEWTTNLNDVPGTL